MMKKGPAVLAALFLSFPSLSAQDVFSRPLNGETLPQYNALCADLASRPVIKGIFEQTKTIKRLNRSLVSSGNFIIAAELGMVWDTRLPFPSVTAVGKDFIIQSTPRGTRSKLDAGGNETFTSLAATISAIFTGNVQSLKENFENYFLGDGRTWALGLIPREKAVAVFAERIILEGDAAGTALIRSITLHERSGDLIRYVLSGHSFPAGLSDDEKALFFLD
ncbi:MAG: outer membrane lipoprotein carrier protein LolA [Treponema sp.]|jgi:hypothetical protein|nr:outer membrane lipoprotein carrier protein LolA [Treponema sp.]